MPHKICLPIEDIKRDYFVNNLTLQQIASIHGTSRNVVVRCFDEAGIKRKTPKEAHIYWRNQFLPWSEEDVQKLKLLYPTIKPFQSIQQYFPNRTIGSITVKAVKIGIKREEQYKINQEFFKSWSNDMAYVLGFFFADGNVQVKQKNSMCASISLSYKDEELLHKIKNALQSEHPVKIKIKKRYNNYTSKQQAVLSISKQDICKDLISLGCVPRKTFVLKFPEMPSMFHSHFIRGYFDGDGTVYVARCKKGNWSKQYTYSAIHCASLGFIQKTLEILTAEANISPRKIHKQRNCHYISFAAGDSKKLYKYMYQDINKSFCLKRKQSLFLSAFGEEIQNVKKEDIAFN